jgi:hypothetical protein
MSPAIAPESPSASLPESSSVATPNNSEVLEPVTSEQEETPAVIPESVSIVTRACFAFNSRTVRGVGARAVFGDTIRTISRGSGRIESKIVRGVDTRAICRVCHGLVPIAGSTCSVCLGNHFSTDRRASSSTSIRDDFRLGAELETGKHFICGGEQ